MSDKEYTATAFTSDGEDVIVYTDEGEEIPIRVEYHRLTALILSCVDALKGEKGTR